MNVHAVLAYPGCPTLSWMLANRVCNKFEDADCLISCTGRKGSGKSTASLSLAEAIAVDISRIRAKGEPASKFFDMGHVRTISETGALELLGSGLLEQENSVFILDDSGAAMWSARNFQSGLNKFLNSIIQIARIYRCVIICNFIMQSHVDIQARGMTDYRMEMQFKNTTTGQSFFKCFFVESTNEREYHKHLTWHGKRIIQWIIEKPSPELEKEYKRMRRENTTTFIQNAQEKVIQKLNPAEKKTDGRARDYGNMPIIVENRDVVRKMYSDGKKIEAIVRETGLTRYWIQRCLFAKSSTNQTGTDPAAYKL